MRLQRDKSNKQSKNKYPIFLFAPDFGDMHVRAGSSIAPLSYSVPLYLSGRAISQTDAWGRLGRSSRWKDTQSSL